MPWCSISPTRQESAEYRAIRRRRARFLVDENLGSRVTLLLRASGWNAKGTEELGLNGHCDRDVFAAARRHSRVLLTQDHDFLDDRQFPPHLNPGIVVLPGAEGDKRLILSVMNDILRIVGVDGALWSKTKVLITDASVWIVRTFEQEHGVVVERRYRLLRHRVEMWEDEP